MQDEELALLFQSGCKIAIDPLVIRYDGLVRATARRYFLQGADQDDLIQEGRIGLCNAVRSFRKDRHRNFDTFAELCVRRRVQSAIRTATRQKHGPLNQAVSWNQNPAEPVVGAIVSGPNHDESVDLNLFLCDQLTALEKAVLSGYLAGHSYLEMGHSLSCLPKSVDNALQRAKRKILNVLCSQ